MKGFQGIVVSKTEKTVMVLVSRRTPHPMYGKLIKRDRKFKADSRDLNPEIGDKVKITETRPISKDKFFKVSEVYKKEKKK